MEFGTKSETCRRDESDEDIAKHIVSWSSVNEYFLLLFGCQRILNEKFKIINEKFKTTDEMLGNNMSKYGSLMKLLKNSLIQQVNKHNGGN